MIEFVCFSNEHDYQPSEFHEGLEVCRICKVTRPTQYALDGGTGCAPEAESTPEVLSAGEVDPRHRQ